MVKKPAKGLPRATLEQKIRILDYYHKSNQPQLVTVEKFKDEVAISTLTFNEWVKRENEYRQRYTDLASEFEKNSKRKAKFKYDNINRAMDLLVQQRLSRGEEITEPILRGYWQIYAHQFGVDNPKRLVGFSHGWLSQFKKRHGLQRRREKDELSKSNEELLAKGKPGADVPQLLIYQGQFPYYEDRRKEDAARSPASLARVMSLPMAVEQKATPADIEKFIFGLADQFFTENQYDYPQTLKLYQEFKQSFLNERLIDLRLSKDAAIPEKLVSRYTDEEVPRVPAPSLLRAQPENLTIPGKRRKLPISEEPSAHQLAPLHQGSSARHTTPIPIHEREYDEVMFAPQKRGDWQKLALRKMWEQNKLMLS